MPQTLIQLQLIPDCSIKAGQILSNKCATATKPNILILYPFYTSEKFSSYFLFPILDFREVLIILNLYFYIQIDIFVAQQFLFQRQWQRVRSYAHKLGISIMGDMPIYVGYHSADVWANKKSFLLVRNPFLWQPFLTRAPMLYQRPKGTLFRKMQKTTLDRQTFHINTRYIRSGNA